MLENEKEIKYIKWINFLKDIKISNNNEITNFLKRKIYEKKELEKYISIDVPKEIDIIKFLLS
jgi:hypothetical protein